MVLPLVYDITNNTTQLAEKRDPAPQYPPTSLQHQAFKILKKYVVSRLNLVSLAHMFTNF